MSGSLSPRIAPTPYPQALAIMGMNGLKAVPGVVAQRSMKFAIALICMIANRSLGLNINYFSEEALRSAAEGIDAVINRLASFIAAKHIRNGNRDYLLDLSSDNRLKLLRNTAPQRIKLYAMNILSMHTRNQRILELAKQGWEGCEECPTLENLYEQLKTQVLNPPPEFGTNEEIIAEIFGRMIPNTSRQTYENGVDRPVQGQNGQQYTLSYELHNHPLTDLGLVPSVQIGNSALALPAPLAKIVNHNLENVFQGDLTLQNRYGCVKIQQEIEQ